MQIPFSAVCQNDLCFARAKLSDDLQTGATRISSHKIAVLVSARDGYVGELAQSSRDSGKDSRTLSAYGEPVGLIFYVCTGEYLTRSVK